MEKLKIIARSYTGMMQKAGLTPDYDDVLGELCLAHCKGVRKYGEGLNHAASQRTYLEACYRRAMLDYAEGERAKTFNEVPIDGVDCKVEDGTHVLPSLREAMEKLDADGRRVLGAMFDEKVALRGAEGPSEAKKGVWLGSLMEATGLPMRKVESAVREITDLALSSI